MEAFWIAPWGANTPHILLANLTHSWLCNSLLVRKPKSGSEFKVLGPALLGTSLLPASPCSESDKLGDEGKKRPTWFTTVITVPGQGAYLAVSLSGDAILDLSTCPPMRQGPRSARHPARVTSHPTTRASLGCSSQLFPESSRVSVTIRRRPTDTLKHNEVS